MNAVIDPVPAPTDPLSQAYARWKATVESELKGVPFEKKLVTRTPEGIALQPLYTRASLAGVANLDAKPGEAPYLRGVRPLGYRGRAWDVAQEFTATTPQEFNRTVLDALMHGQNAVVLTADAAARCGLDPDEAPAHVGVGGVSLADASDVAAALAKVDVTAVPVFVDGVADAFPLAALVLEAARRVGVNWAALHGRVAADPLGEWARTGGLTAPLEELYRSLAGWTVWVETRAPEMRTVGVDARHWGNAGATATQELALALATGAEYLRELAARGVTPAAAARRIAFQFTSGPVFFTEIAKFRAFRPLWTRVLTAFGAAPEAAAGATVGVSTGDWNKSLLDPHVNMLRVTTEALSAVLGGCDQLHIGAFDDVAGATTDLSRRIARNIHTLLAEEFSFAEVADPAGGSWYVEKLTDEVARTAWAIFQDIEARGGMAEALRTGYPQQLVAKADGEKLDALKKRRTGLVGANLFPNLKETPLSEARRDADKAGALVAEFRLRRGRSRRVLQRKGDWSERFDQALAAAHEGATIGELARLSLGERVELDPITRVIPRRGAEAFETLRATAAAFAQRTGTRPKVFLARMGPPLQHKARADFSSGFFATGGFETVGKQAFASAAEAAAAAIASKAPVVVLCSTDETYPALVPEFAAAVRAGAPRVTIVLAGLPAEPAVVAAYRAAGVDEFIHLRADVHATLTSILKKAEALS